MDTDIHILMKVCGENSEEFLHFIAGEVHDTKVITCDIQFCANIPSPNGCTYLRVRDDGSVHIDGNQDQPETVFRVDHVFTPEKDYYEIICKGGKCANYILYVDETNSEKKLKARPYEKKVDSLNRGYNEPKHTLFKFQYDNSSNVSMTPKDDTHYHFTQGSAENGGNSTIVLSKNPSDFISFEAIIQ